MSNKELISTKNQITDIDITMKCKVAESNLPLKSI